MNYAYICKTCWRIIVADTGQDRCEVCCNMNSLLYHDVDKQSILHMLWSVFSQFKIDVGTIPSDISVAKFDNSNIYFDFIIPEARVCIDIIDDHQYISTDELNNSDMDDLELRSRYNEFKSGLLFDNNYRYITIPSNISKARNTILDNLNRFGVLSSDTTSPQVLPPAYSGDAGLDLVVSEDIEIPPYGDRDIPSDVKLELPAHTFAFVHARSSSNKRRLQVLTGLIDSSYRGYLFAMVHNLTNKAIKVKKGDRIAQLIIMQRLPQLEAIYKTKLMPSDRAEKGFGSSGASVNDMAK